MMVIKGKKNIVFKQAKDRIGGKKKGDLLIKNTKKLSFRKRKKEKIFLRLIFILCL
jgi:hypothetical protein